MKILIEPFDTLFFREGKPFSSGEETISYTLPFPYPSTIYGAIMSAYISQNNLSLSKKTLEELSKNLRILQIALFEKVSNMLLYPVPYDLVKEKIYSNLYPLNLENVYNSNLDFPKIPIYKNINKENFKGFIYSEDFKKYLESNIDITNTIDIKESIFNEFKIGIGINNITNSVTEGHLYRLQITRLRKDIFSEDEEVNLKIFVEFEGLNLKNEGYLKLGGENKVVYYKKIEDDYDKEIKNLSFSLNSNIFKLYLLTPAIFKNGYLTNWMDKKKFLKFKPKWCDETIEIKLLSITTGKFLSIGGFNFKENKLKSMKKAVPEGSIYYFETKEKDINKIKKCFHFQSISDYEELRQKGFGITIVGNYNKS